MTHIPFHLSNCQEHYGCQIDCPVKALVQELDTFRNNIAEVMSKAAEARKNEADHG
jgi:hypothetical protein